MKLPTDPQARNDERAHWAQVTLAACVAETRTDEAGALVEFLAGVVHWSDRSGESFDDQSTAVKIEAVERLACTPLLLVTPRVSVTGSRADPCLGKAGPRTQGPADGVVTLLVGGRRCLQRVFPSSRSGHCSPCPHSFAAKLAKCLTADQVTLNVEGVVDGGVC